MLMLMLLLRMKISNGWNQAVTRDRSLEGFEMGERGDTKKKISK